MKLYLALVVMLRMKNLDYINQFILPTVSAANVVVTLLTCHRCYKDWRLETGELCPSPLIIHIK